MEVDFTDKIKQCKAYGQDDDHKPMQQHDMNCPSCGCSLGKMYVKYGTVMATNLILPDRMPYASNMFANEEDGKIVPPQPETKNLENPRNKHEYDVNRDVDGGEEVDLSEYSPKTKGLENPRNMNEYYKNLYKKVKGLD